MSEPRCRLVHRRPRQRCRQHLPVSLIVGVGCVFLALFLAAALLIGMVRPDDRAKRLAERIERYGSRHVARRARPLARIADRLVSPVLRKRHRGHGWNCGSTWPGSGGTRPSGCWPAPA